jgi:hypothetical protein
MEKHEIDALVVKAYNAAYSVGYYNTKEDSKKSNKYFSKWCAARKIIVEKLQAS